MADRLDGLDPEDRERLLAAFQAADIELDKLIANWPASCPRITERRLQDRYRTAMQAVLPDDLSDKEFTEDEFDDAEVLLLAMTEFIQMSRRFKELLGTGGPELRVLKGGKAEQP